MRSWFVMLLAVLVMSPPAWGDPFSVDSWELQIYAQNGTTTMGPMDILEEVQNPFSDSHSVAFDATIAAASYDFAWDEGGGRFDVESDLQTEYQGWSCCDSLVTGQIDITPSVDLLFHVDATMDFTAPVYSMWSALYLDVVSGTQDALHVAEAYDAGESGIGSGSLAYEGDFVLSAGRTWVLSYVYLLPVQGFDGVEPGTVATANGDVSFTFQVVPEPSSVGLLLMGSLAVFNRRRRSSGRIRG